MEGNVQPDGVLDVTQVMRNIFTACDAECRNSVPVSRLVDYITPFMEANMSDLMELKAALDPDDKDPEISSNKFYTVMAEWTTKFNEGSNSFHNISAGHLGLIEDKALPFVQSTPRASFGNKLNKVSVEVGILNASMLSNQSFVDNGPGVAGLEKSYYEDQINELTHQNKKYSEELLHIKLQLVSTEEQNEILQTDLEKLKKQLIHEHEIIEELQKDIRDCEELRDASLNAHKQTERAEKNLQLAEKENLQLKQKILKFEIEKQESEERIANMHKKVSEKVTLLIELQTEMKVKDGDLAHLEDVNNNLLYQLNEQKKIIDDYQESTRCMQVEKEKLQKILHDRMKKKTKAVSQSFSDEQVDSPPCLYVVDRSGSPHRSFRADPILTSPNVSTFSINDSSDEEFFMRLQTTTSSHSPHESLKTEISKVTVDDKEDISKTSEYDDRITYLEHELKQHQLDNNRLNVEKLKLENDVCLSNIKQLTADNESIQTQLANAMERLTSLKSDKEELEKINAATHKSRSEFESKIRSLTAENAKINDDFDKLQTAKEEIEENYTSKLDELKIKNSEYNELIRDLQRENHVLKQNIRNLKEENENVLRENETLNVTLWEKIDAINAKETKFESETCHLQAQVDSIQIAHDSLKDNLIRIKCNNLEEVKVLQRKIAELLEEHESTENDKEKQHLELKRRIASQGESIRSLEDQLSEKDAVVRGLKEENFEALKRLKDEENARIDSEGVFEQAVRELEDKIRAMDGEKAAYEERNSEIAGNLRELQKELERLVLEKNNMKTIEEFERVEESLAVSESENQLLHQKLKTFEDKSKRVNHDKMQVKLEKQLERVDYLEEQLHKERRDRMDLEGKMRDADEMYSTNKSLTNAELGENRRNLSRTTHNFLQKWRHHFEKMSSMDDILDLFDNGDSPRLCRGLNRPLGNELCLLKREVTFVVRILETLADISFPVNGNNNEENQVTLISSVESGASRPSKFTLKPPTLIIRPMSPDSPNLEINQPNYVSPPLEQKRDMSPDSGGVDAVTASCIGAGDITVESFTRGSFSTDEVKSSESDFLDASASHYEDAVDGFLSSSSSSPFIKLDYSYEDYKTESLTDEELEERFTAFVQDFTKESESIKRRFESQADQVRRTESSLYAAMRGIMSLVRTSLVGQSIQQGEILVPNIATAVCQLCRLAERFGALKHENKLIPSVSMMINYTSSLSIKLETATRSLCRFTNRRIETVSIENYNGNNNGMFSSTFTRGAFCSALTTMFMMSVIFCLFVFSRVDYPTWNELLNGFVRKEYRNGPPPM